MNNTEQQFVMMAQPHGRHQDATVNEGIQNASDFRNVLLKGEPKVLGAIQLVIVFIHVALGAIFIQWDSYITYTAYYGISLYGIPFFIISGSLSIVVEKKSKSSVSLVRSFIAMNILSAIESLATIGVFCYDIYRCEYYSSLPKRYTTILIFLSLTNLLQFSITVSLATFGTRSLAVMSASAQKTLSDVFVVPNPYIDVMANSASQQSFQPARSHLWSAETRFPHDSYQMDIRGFQVEPSQVTPLPMRSSTQYVLSNPDYRQ
ncbi:membrane-spanning 4-domains subfamily A member 4A-like [Leptodactylus fuscus]|uniref:membrane-spanning 4-domains subfamily A member 4A-like n=1 Tax=Leptodactylus fuscus TaxID=238119 RepID=UPI003F4E6432